MTVVVSDDTQLQVGTSYANDRQEELVVRFVAHLTRGFSAREQADEVWKWLLFGLSFSGTSQFKGVIRP